MSKDNFGIDPKDLKKQEESEAKVNRDEKLRLNDMRKVLSTPEGRRQYWHLLSKSGVFTASFSLNSVQTAYNEGMRSVGITVLAEIMTAKPEAFYAMYTEEMSKKKSEEHKKELNDEESLS